MKNLQFFVCSVDYGDGTDDDESLMMVMALDTWQESDMMLTVDDVHLQGRSPDLTYLYFLFDNLFSILKRNSAKD